MKLILLIFPILMMSFSCSKIQSQLTESASSPEQLNSPEIPVDEIPQDLPVTAELKIDISSNDSKIIVDVDQKESVKEIIIYINSEDQGTISNLPYNYSYNAIELAGQKIEVKVNVLSLTNKLYSKTSSILVPEPVSQPLPGQPPSDPTAQPVVSPDCLSDQQYDACIFFKNPVAHVKRSFTSKITYGDDLDEHQTYAVNITGRTDPSYLKNLSIDVFATSGIKAKISSASKWKASYKDDFGVHKLVQVLSYYWANEQIKFMKSKGGAFYAENKNIKIDAFNNSVKNNAYWNGSQVVLGNFGSQEIALSSEVLLHELGHANLDFATNRQIRLTSKYCATKMGCIGAIHEGQGDIHAFLFFSGDSKMSQTITNTLDGWKNRNPANYVSKNLDYFFNTHSGGGEIHGMGTAYATILWQIMTDSSMIRDDFAKMFSMHLPRLTNSSNFSSAKTVWLNLSDVHFNSKYNSIIEKYFNKMGVN